MKLLIFLLISISVSIPKPNNTNLELGYDNEFLVKNKNDIFFVFRSNKGVSNIVITDEIKFLEAINKSIFVNDTSAANSNKRLIISLKFSINKNDINVQVEKIKMLKGQIDQEDEKLKELSKTLNELEFYSLGNSKYNKSNKMDLNCSITVISTISE